MTDRERVFVEELVSRFDAVLVEGAVRGAAISRTSAAAPMPPAAPSMSTDQLVMRLRDQTERFGL